MDDRQLPDRAKHEDDIVAAQMRQRAADENVGCPRLFFCCAELRDRYGSDFSAFAGFRLYGKSLIIDKKIVRSRVPCRSFDD